MFYAYILQSEQTHTFYYGHTHDIAGRLKRHNQGKVRSTKSKRPWRLHHVEEFESRSEAYQRERFYKSVSGYRYLKDQKIV